MLFVFGMVSTWHLRAKMSSKRYQQAKDSFSLRDYSSQAMVRMRRWKRRRPTWFSVYATPQPHSRVQHFAATAFNDPIQHGSTSLGCPG
jgi:hypothetical protein